MSDHSDLSKLTCEVHMRRKTRRIVNEEALIEAVRQLPCLWQTSSKKYKDLRAKENTWMEIARSEGMCSTESDR